MAATAAAAAWLTFPRLHSAASPINDQIALVQQIDEGTDLRLLRNYGVVQRLDLLKNYDLIRHLNELQQVSGPHPAGRS